MQTQRLTMAQALILFLKNQYVERDGKRHRFFGGCFGIFGHGNLAGVGQALHQYSDFLYFQSRNEQAMVHTAAAYAKTTNRLRALACTTSIGPGATNMVTGAAGATINRLPVLLLPGDIFANRAVAPVLQQLEQAWSQDVSVNDCFKPVSRYWDRINRPEQILTALPEAMRVLTSPSETGAVTLALPQDVQAEAFDYPEAFFKQRVWSIPRPRADATLLSRAAQWIRRSKKPLIVAGGGVIYSDAGTELAALAELTGIPVAETQAGKGSLPYNHPLSLGGLGVTGTRAANHMARKADLIVGIGTRYSDFTTASKTLFQNEKVRFVNINVAELDAFKHAALPLVADARETLKELSEALKDYHVPPSWMEEAHHLHQAWDDEVQRIYDRRGGRKLTQAEVIGVVNEFSHARDVVVCAAGSLPGDLHKLWRTLDSKGYHLEYGYSCMGYEIAGGLGVKMAAPDREVYVMVGDGSYLMMSQEIVTSIQEGYKLNIILLDNHGFASIGGLSESVGSGGFGTHYRYRNAATGHLDGELLPVDLAANARSLGAHVITTYGYESLSLALSEAREQSRTTVILVETARDERVSGYDAWWDVPVAEVSEQEPVQAARQRYETARRQHRYYL